MDLFVVDMLSRDSDLRKRQAPAQDLSDRLVNQGKYADQVMRNTLLNNRGDGSFAELAKHGWIVCFRLVMVACFSGCGSGWL